VATSSTKQHSGSKFNKTKTVTASSTKPKLSQQNQNIHTIYNKKITATLTNLSFEYNIAKLQFQNISITNTCQKNAESV